MKYSRKGGELQPTHPNVNSGGKPSTPRLASSSSGYLATSSLTLGVETALGALCRQVLLRLTNSAPENLSAKCTSCSFNTSTPKFMFEFTSPRKLGSVNSEHELRCTRRWVGEVLPLFRRTSYSVQLPRQCDRHPLAGPSPGPHIEDLDTHLKEIHDHMATLKHCNTDHPVTRSLLSHSQSVTLSLLPCHSSTISTSPPVTHRVCSPSLSSHHHTVTPVPATCPCHHYTVWQWLSHLSLPPVPVTMTLSDSDCHTCHSTSNSPSLQSWSLCPSAAPWTGCSGPRWPATKSREHWTDKGILH